jgi:hypothetical protein
VTLGLGLEHYCPFVQRVSRKPIHFQDWWEGLVFVVAHEFEHIRQFAAGEESTEMGANRVGLMALERYRLAMARLEALEEAEAA